MCPDNVGFSRCTTIATSVGNIARKRKETVQNEMMTQSVCNAFKLTSGRKVRILVGSESNTKTEGYVDACGFVGKRWLSRVFCSLMCDLDTDDVSMFVDVLEDGRMKGNQSPNLYAFVRNAPTVQKVREKVLRYFTLAGVALEPNILNSPVVFLLCEESFHSVLV